VYGKRVLYPFRKGTDPDEKIVYDDEKEPWCNDRFKTFVTRDSIIETDECKTSRTSPLLASYTNLSIQIFQTKKTNPDYTTDPGVEKVADLTVELGSAMSLPKEQREVDTRLYFGDTQIRVEAENVYTGQVQKAQIRWTPTW
jgi:hypothetical protein